MKGTEKQRRQRTQSFYRFGINHSVSSVFFVPSIFSVPSVPLMLPQQLHNSSHLVRNAD